MEIQSIGENKINLVTYELWDNNFLQKSILIVFLIKKLDLIFN